MVDKPIIELYASAGHFDEAALNKATSALEPHFEVSGGLLYQFSDLPSAKVLLEFALATLQQIAPSILASALWDGMKQLLKPKHSSETILYLDVICGRRKLSSRLITNDPHVLHEALETWQETILQLDISTFDDDQLLHEVYNASAQSWERVGAPETTNQRRQLYGGTPAQKSTKSASNQPVNSEGRVARAKVPHRKPTRRRHDEGRATR